MSETSFQVHNPDEINPVIKDLYGKTAELRNRLNKKDQQELILMLQQIEDAQQLPEKDRLANPENVLAPLIINRIVKGAENLQN